MAYYGRRSYRSWRSRGYGASQSPSKYSALSSLFGGGVEEIRKAFLSLDDEALDELFSDYGAIYKSSAEAYARKTFPNWKSGKTALSGQTMERLIELVPPYLSPETRFSILQSVLKRHKGTAGSRTIRINVKSPEAGFSELEQALSTMTVDDALAHLPDRVMKAANWLWDDDITSARAMLAEAERRENDIVRASATREIDLLRRTISSGQVKAANYSVTMPAGRLSVVAYSPSSCYVATVCFGEHARETKALRLWRDQYLLERPWGRRFVVWYYRNGEAISKFFERSELLKKASRIGISTFVNILQNFVKDRQ